jgi:tetratricopeptide (TPR) repeat protein
MTDEQRQTAIAQKKAEMNGLLDSASYQNAVKLTIWVPKVAETFPQGAAETLAARMLQITSQNGIAGYGGNPSFVLAAEVTPFEQGVTATAPAKTYIRYKVNFFVANVTSGEIFGASQQDVMGVGDSETMAMLNAMQSVASDDGLQNMLKQSSQKIVNWYESHKSTVIGQINNYVRIGNYAKAYAMLISIPEEAKTCFEYAQKHLDEVHNLYLNQLSNEYYQRMLSAMAENEGCYNPTVGAYMVSIPLNAPVYAKAEKAFNEYIQRIQSIADAQRAHEMYMEEEQLAIEKIRAESELKAQEALIAQSEADVRMEQARQETEQTNIVGDKFVSIITFGIEKLLGFLFL